MDKTKLQTVSIFILIISQITTGIFFYNKLQIQEKEIKQVKTKLHVLKDDVDYNSYTVNQANERNNDQDDKIDDLENEIDN